MNQTCTSVDEYISSCSEDVQGSLIRLRKVIRNAAPKSTEKISYGMPFYEFGGTGFKGRLLYFAAFKKHISLFIAPSLSANLPKELMKYHASKATYQFSTNQPLPFDLIRRTVEELVRAKTIDMENVHASSDIAKYNSQLDKTHKELCNSLCIEINKGLTNAESKIWHGHPVWFLEGNPIVGYSQQKKGIRLMFWSGIDFNEPGLNVIGKKFKDASVFYNSIKDLCKQDLKRWIKKSISIQWDYKNIVKRKGKLERLK